MCLLDGAVFVCSPRRSCRLLLLLHEALEPEVRVFNICIFSHVKIVFKRVVSYVLYYS